MEKTIPSNVPRILIISLGVLLLAVLPSYFFDEYAKAAVLFSNLAYLCPFLISAYAKNTDFTLIMLITIIISVMYHSCRSYDACFNIALEGWESIDVMFSWFTLLTLASYIAFKNRFLHLAPLNVAIIFWSREAHCGDQYQCRYFKIAVLMIYLAYTTYHGLVKTKLYDIIDLALAVAFFIIAACVYLFLEGPANHCLWHIASALSISFLITVFRTSKNKGKFHTLGFRSLEEQYTTVNSGSVSYNNNDRIDL